MGKRGWVRSSAWMEVFSSTESTTALSGGCRYNPTTASIFGSNSGSGESFQYRTRWGWRDSDDRTERTTATPTPRCRARVRTLNESPRSRAVSCTRWPQSDDEGQHHIFVGVLGPAGPPSPPAG